MDPAREAPVSALAEVADLADLTPLAPDQRPAPQYPIESVDRTLSVITLLGERHEVKLGEVRDHLGVGQSTAHRLMAMLVYRGFAVQDPTSRAYRAGPSLMRLGRAALGDTDLVTHARPALVWLAARSGETVHLGLLADTEVRYLDAVVSEALLRVTSRVGQLQPAHATSLGKAMLATLDDGELRRRYAGLPLEGMTPRTTTHLDALLRQLRATRRRGWAVNRGEIQSGVHSVGVAAVHPARGLLCALSIATPAARSSPALEREHAALLQRASDRLIALSP